MKKENTIKIKKYTFLAFGFVILTFLVYISFLLWKTWPITEYSLNKAGLFGDSFGILTSFFSGLAFSGMIMTLLMQKEELKLQRKELSYTRTEIKGQKEALEKQQKEMVAQNFDNKFFQMLHLFNNIRENLKVDNQKGQKAIEELKKLLIINCASNYDYQGQTYTIESIEKFKGRFIKFNKDYDTNFKYYFLNLYQILNYIDKNNLPDAKSYSNIIRAQLSKDELVLLFYNAIGIIDIGGENYKKLVEKYSIFEHLTKNDIMDYIKYGGKNISPNSNLIQELTNEYNKIAFGKN